MLNIHKWLILSITSTPKICNNLFLNIPFLIFLYFIRVQTKNFQKICLPSLANYKGSDFTEINALFL